MDQEAVDEHGKIKDQRPSLNRDQGYHLSPRPWLKAPRDYQVDLS